MASQNLEDYTFVQSHWYYIYIIGEQQFVVFFWEQMI